MSIQSAEQQKSYEFTRAEHVVHVGLKNVIPVVDNTNHFGGLSLLDVDPYLVITSPFGDDYGSIVALRTGSDGRSVGFTPDQPLMDNHGNVFADVQVKGVGIPTKSNVRMVNYPSKVTSEGDVELVPYTNLITGRVYPIRFSTNEIRGIGSGVGLGATVVPTGEVEMSNILIDSGLRTRRLILAAKYGPKVVFMTDDGPKRMEVMSADLGYDPFVEVWAMRCRHRAVDIFNYPKFEGFNYPFEVQRLILGDIKLQGDGTVNRIDDPYHVRIRREALGQFDKDIIESDFEALKQEILLRAKIDTDRRFADLEDSGSFWEDYLEVFSSLLGEQVGIMYSAGAFTRNNMLNSQNVTLLAEIVDHDVTFIDPEMKKSSSQILEQFSQTLETLTTMINYLYAFDLIPEETQVDRYLSNYSNGIIASLDDTDRSLLVGIMTGLQEGQSDILETNRIIENLRLSRVLKVGDPSAIDHLDEIDKSLIWCRQNIAYTYERLQSGTPRFCLANDVTGRGSIPFVVRSLALKSTNHNPR